jgi:uncharacterized protein
MSEIHENKKLQLFLGLLGGVLFGFFLQKSGVTKYDVILNQLRLRDFTVLKVMLSAVIVTMLGISYLYPRKKINLHVKKGSIKNSIIGGLIFGAGFGILGYCPGTIAGAVGNGYIDGLTGGIIGIILGSGIFASLYSILIEKNIITEDRFSKLSLFDRIDGSPFKLTVPFSIFLIVFMLLIE